MWARLFGRPSPPAELQRRPLGDVGIIRRTHRLRDPTSIESKLRRRFGKKGSNKYCFNMPTGVAVTAMGDVVVVDSENSRIQVFTSDGQLRLKIGEKGCLPHQLNHPMGVSLTRDADEHIVVSDSVNAALKVYMQDGTFVTQYGHSGMFDFPYGVAMTSDHHFVVTDVCKHCVMVLYPSGSIRSQFGKYGDRLADFDHPYFVAVDRNDHIIVSDSGNTCIKRHNRDGTLLQCFTLKDFRLYDEHFVLLQGVCVDHDNNVLVVGNSTVYIVAPNGRLWEVVLPVDGLHSPRAVAYSGLGQLVVTQCGLDHRHEVCFFSYCCHDYHSLRSVPRVMVLAGTDSDRGEGEQEVGGRGMTNSYTQTEPCATNQVLASLQEDNRNT